MIAALIQSRLVAGASTIWKHSDVSSSQRLAGVTAPMNSRRTDHGGTMLRPAVSSEPKLAPRCWLAAPTHAPDPGDYAGQDE